MKLTAITKNKDIKNKTDTMGFFVVTTNTPEKMAIKDNTSNTIGYNPLIRSTDTIYKFMFIEKKKIIFVAL
jgi:hypothetical protein